MYKKTLKTFFTLGAICLLISPFIIGYGIFVLLAPVGFWQMAIWFLISLIVCGFIGFFAWLSGLAILYGMWG